MTRVVFERVTRSFQPTRSHARPIVALDAVSLEVEPGEFLAVLGPSGCGKTTLLRLAAGLEVPQSGRVLLNGSVAAEMAPADRQVALVSPGGALYPQMSVRDNILFGLKVRKLSVSEQASRWALSAETLQVGDWADRLPHELSSGQRQRVALARAFALQPGLFLLDEPLSNLDGLAKADIRESIARLHQRTQATLIYVTHDLAEGCGLAQRVVILNQGRLEQTGSTDQVLKNPATPFVARFLGSAASGWPPPGRSAI